MVFRRIFREMYGEEVTSKKLRGNDVHIHAKCIDVWLNNEDVGTIHYEPAKSCSITQEALKITKIAYFTSTSNGLFSTLIIVTDGMYEVYLDEDGYPVVDKSSI